MFDGLTFTFTPEFVITTTYLAVAFFVLFAVQSVFLLRATATSAPRSSVLLAFVYGSGLGMLLAYLLLLVLPVLWPLGGA